jgi:large subunit ribosomal protein L14
MKSISAKITPALQVGSYVKCTDNSGATQIQVIAVKGYKGVMRRKPYCGVGSWVIAAVKRGNSKIVHEVVQAVIVRQKKEYRRRSGMRIKFEDNAAVLVNEKGDPRGTIIKGPIAKEVVERFSTIGKIASIVV